MFTNGTQNLPKWTPDPPKLHPIFLIYFDLSGARIISRVSQKNCILKRLRPIPPGLGSSVRVKEDKLLKALGGRSGIWQHSYEMRNWSKGVARFQDYWIWLLRALGGLEVFRSICIKRSAYILRREAQRLGIDRVHFWAPLGWQEAFRSTFIMWKRC